MPLMINADKWDKITEDKIKPTQNDEREHFDFYFSTKDNVDWNESTEIGFILSEYESKLSIRCQPVRDNSMSTTSVTKLTDESEQYRFYIPRSIIRSLELSNKHVELYHRNNSVSIVPK